MLLLMLATDRRFIYVQRHYITSPNARRPHKQTTLSTNKSLERSCGSTGTSKPKFLPPGKLLLLVLQCTSSCPVFLTHPPLPTANRNFASSPPGSQILLPRIPPLGPCPIFLRSHLPISTLCQPLGHHCQQSSKHILYGMPPSAIP